MFTRPFHGLPKSTAAAADLPVIAGCVGWLLSLALIVTPRAAIAQLSVSQPEVLLKSNVTARRTSVIKITNRADQPAEAVFNVQDWHRDETGASTFLPLGTGAGSCREQLKVFPASVRIEPHQTEPVRVSFDGAYDKSCWAVVFVQSNEPRPAMSRLDAAYAPTGVKVYVQPEWAKREGKVESLTLGMMPVSDRNPTRVRGVEVLFRNTGDVHLETVGAVEVRNADNLVLATVDIARFPIAPADLRRIRVPLPKLPPGRYHALVLFDYLGPDIAEHETQFEIR